VNRRNLPNQNRDPQFDLRNNLNQGREKAHRVQEELKNSDNVTQGARERKSVNPGSKDMASSTGKDVDKEGLGNRHEGVNNTSGSCLRCGKFGHTTEECHSPVICTRCNKEGHVPRVCSEVFPWECIAPFCGFTAPGQGFHYIHSGTMDEGGKDMTSCALIRITKGIVTAKQLENEFKAQAGPSSTWRWYAKKIFDGIFQMRFPSAKKVEDLAFFPSM